MELAFEGQAQIVHDGSVLGTVRVSIGPAPSDSDMAWSGQIIGSDYLMWGLNHKKVQLVLPTGEPLSCVVLATGKLRGLRDVERDL